MGTNLLDVQSAASHDIVSVRVVAVRGGGWDVIATLGDHVLARQHHDDWHKTERAWARMRAAASRHRSEAA